LTSGQSIFCFLIVISSTITWKEVLIVGLLKKDTARTCDKHILKACGASLTVGETVSLRTCQIPLEGVGELVNLMNGGTGVEVATEIVRVKDGITSCRLGFVSREFGAQYRNRMDGKTAEVVALIGRESNCTQFERREWNRNYGYGKIKFSFLSV
jgi:hypothetical protein